MKLAGVEEQAPQAAPDSWEYETQHHRLKTERSWRLTLGGAFLVLTILLWEWFGRIHGGLLFAPFSETAVALVDMVRSGIMLEALWLSNQTLVLGFFLGVLIAVPSGILLGRSQFFEGIADPYLNILVVTPMAGIIPLVIVFIGLNTAARVFIVFLFCAPVIAINARTGLKKLDPELVDMGHSFSCSELQLWRYILLPGALPAVMTGVRLGLGRALSAMIVVELLLSGVGLGKLILEETSRFEAARAYAVVIVIIIEAVLLMNAVRYVEKHMTAWQSKPDL